MKPNYETLMWILRDAYDRGYFDPHPDDSEMEKDEKARAREAVNYKEIPYDSAIPEYGDLYTVRDFRNAVESGLFIDYDGFGHPVKHDKVNNDMTIQPSRVHMIPDDATHIVWFNR